MESLLRVMWEGPAGNQKRNPYDWDETIRMTRVISMPADRAIKE
jgi:hypothetical protein